MTNGEPAAPRPGAGGGRTSRPARRPAAPAAASAAGWRSGRATRGPRRSGRRPAATGRRRSASRCRSCCPAGPATAPGTPRCAAATMPISPARPGPTSPRQHIRHSVGPPSGRVKLALVDVAVPLVQRTVPGRGRLVVGGHPLGVGPLQHVAQEGRPDARGPGTPAPSRGTGSSTAAPRGGARRSLLQLLEEAADGGARRAPSSAARTDFLLGGQQRGVRRQPHRGAVAVGGQVRLAVRQVGVDVDLEHRHDRPPAGARRPAAAIRSPGRRRSRRRRWRRPSCGRRMSPGGCRWSTSGEGHGRSPVLWVGGRTVPVGTGAGIGRHPYHPSIGRTRSCCTANSAAAAPGRDADLGVDVLGVVLGGAAGDDQPLGDLGVAAPGGDQPSTSTSRSLSPAGRCRRRPGACPASASTAARRRGRSGPPRSRR